MFGQNIIKPLKEYGHSYGSNANPTLSSNVHRNCSSSSDKVEARKMKKRLGLTLGLLKKKKLVKLCIQLDLPTGGTKKDLRNRILND
jgi:hypothetical protein